MTLTNHRTTIGFTGHQGLTAATTKSVQRELRQRLAVYDPVAGCCSLAEGADQLFGELVLERAGELRVVLPCRRYAETFDDPDDLDRYHRLLAQTGKVTTLDFDEPSEEAFWAAGRLVVDDCDVLFAVWNGRPAGGLGGTADVVSYAKTTGRPVQVIWPPGARREETAT